VGTGTKDIELAGAVRGGYEHVLTPDALTLVAELQREFGFKRAKLLDARRDRRARLAQGGTLDFLDDTRDVREGDWTVAPVPQDLQQRWVEITGPPSARWSSTRSTPARTASWPTSRTRTPRPGRT
jgi:malate synthase